MSQNQTVIIDDQNLSYVTYTGTWLRGGSPSENNGTVASSTTVGDYFDVKFTGTSIVVYGTIDITSGGVLTNYSIDSGTAQQATSQSGSGDTYRQQFWGSPTLNIGDHTLRVTMAKVNSDQEAGEGTIWFDYFSVTDPRIKSGPSTIAPSSKRTNAGAFAGGVVGGVILVAAIALLSLFFRKRTAKRRSAHVRPIFYSEGPEFRGLAALIDTHYTVAPFVMHPEIDEPSSAVANSLFGEIRTHKPRQNENSNTGMTTMATMASSSTLGTPGTIPVSPRSGKQWVNDGLPSSSSIPGPAELPSTSQPVQHVDSGVRNLDSVTVPAALATELPPVYTPV